MTNTKDKLNEAKFFLEEMIRVSSEIDKFRYMLTAFLAASRSITQIMQKEFSERAGFTEWYAQKREEMKRSPILKYLHEQRIITFHQRPVLQYPIGVTQQITDSAGINIFLSGTGSNLIQYSVLANLPIIQPSITVKYYFDDIKEKDVITICQEAVNAIESTVTECEAKFCGSA